MNELLEQSELLKLINPKYLQFDEKKAAKWPHKSWGGVPEEVAMENIAILDQMMKDEGYSVEARAAAATNAYAESGFNNHASGDSGKSIGLFQLHQNGGGSGMTKEQRSDVVTNVTRMLDSIAGRPVPKRPDKIAAKFKKVVTSGQNDLSKLTFAFCRYFERPRYGDKDANARAATARAMFPGLVKTA